MKDFTPYPLWMTVHVWGLGEVSVPYGAKGKVKGYLEPGGEEVVILCVPGGSAKEAESDLTR